ncbi:xanthine dehydrogenase family protein molybdopterin-binding subunit [Undibacterium sp. LX40W]|uniref:Xanthine dehydrogenase family protein molybdopterin-binding subunit n=1 Tax=Undibacterium nitidum TaxID=2762298 RepID=A0A923KR92_9BURK|nr:MULTISPECIES: xanthine dehydrogenase family protein molybdopterin-binding subunit [Undibacterium]MBC3879976.1 xanthine dehydrogenase family protein molybdopterin-binding subunit [Undibacterium nitidum]MBC3891288.1 xanthine dehydrogenase family protein molybdopterin-binding subunit [Undibacterium sp. LX40W]
MKFDQQDDLSRLPKILHSYLKKSDSAEVTVQNRRHFLKLSVGAGFSLGMFSLAADAQEVAQAAAGLKPFQQPQAFLNISHDGIVTVTINRLEFGQGIQTALAMILAEELDADWSKVRGVHGNANPAYVDPAFGMHITGGSGSVKNSFTQYRELGARARAMLIAAAASKWNVSPATIHTDAGVIVSSDGRKMNFAEVADLAMQQSVPAQVTLKDPKQFRIIGKQTGRLDARAKSTGTQHFGIDVQRPGMLTAVIAHPPVFGAKLKSIDDLAAKKIAGVKAVFRMPVDRGGEGVAVIAEGYWAAKQARDALKLEWNTDQLELVDSIKQKKQYQALAKTTGKLKYNDDVSALSKTSKKISAEFYFPYLAHAAMEPLNCTIEVTGTGTDQKAQVWVGSQMPGMDTMAAANALGIPPQNVMIHVQMAGGGFGRRAIPSCDYVTESAQLTKLAYAMGITAPIRTMWSREDDMRGGYYRPAHLHRAEIAYDDQGKVLAWDHVIVGQSIVAGSPFESFLMKDGIDGTAVEGMREPYHVPMRLSVHHPKVNVPVLWWRSVGSTHTAFVMETLLDELARKTKQDPVDYRLKLMADKAPRHKAALQLAVEKSGYGKRKLPKDHAWGVAVHESFETVVAYIITASVKNGKPQLRSVTAGVHCNLAVNPKTIEAQIQGAAVMALSMCLPGSEITFKEGKVQQSNFSDYTVARMPDVPDINVHIVPSADSPTGIGEPGLPPLAPAFANAIARLTGKNLRSLPFQMS